MQLLLAICLEKFFLPPVELSLDMVENWRIKWREKEGEKIQLVDECGGAELELS